MSASLLTSSRPSPAPHNDVFAPSRLSIMTGSGNGASTNGERRQMFYAVRKGNTIGVFRTWAEAEVAIKDYATPEWKTFKTQLAAEAFIAGGSGSGSPRPVPAPYKVRYGTPAAQRPLPPTPPRSLPLQERLERHFPPSVPASSSTSLRSRPRPRSLPHGGMAPSPSLASAYQPNDPFLPLTPPRPAFARKSSSGSSSSLSGSPVRRSSPLRQSITDGDEEDEAQDQMGEGLSDSASFGRRRGASVKLRGLMSPPDSPTKFSRIEELDRAGTGRSLFPASPMTMGSARSLRRKSSSSSMGSVESSGTATPQKRASVGLWGDLTPASPPKHEVPLLTPPFSPVKDEHGGFEIINPTEVDPAFMHSNAPKFSRSAMKKSEVLLPLAASQVNSPSGSKATSPSISPKHSMLSLKRAKRMTAPVGNFSLASLHDRLETLSLTSRSHRASASTADLPEDPATPMAEQENAQHSRAASVNRLRSPSSVSGMSSDSIGSFSTAREHPTGDVVDLTDSPLEELHSGDGHALEDSSAEVSSENLEPVTSNPSDASFGTSARVSVATHTQSESALGGGAASKYGKTGAQAKKSGFGKKLLKALGFGSGREPGSARRFSS